MNPPSTTTLAWLLVNLTGTNTEGSGEGSGAVVSGERSGVVVSGEESDDTGEVVDVIMRK